MILQSEKRFLKIIKYAPFLIVFFVSILHIMIIVYENKEKFKIEKSAIEQKFTEENMQQINEKVNLAYNIIINAQENAKKQLEYSLKEDLDNAYNIAYSLYIANQHKSEKEIKSLIITALRNVSFKNERGYLFIYEKTGVGVMFPKESHLEGLNDINTTDSRGIYYIKEIIDLLKDNDELYYEWHWKKPNETKEQKKIGYFKNFKPFNWFIATGEYFEGFEKEVQEKVLNTISQIRYKENEYIFVINYDSIYLNHIRKKFIGQSVLLSGDIADSKKVFSQFVKIAKNGEGYYSYIQNEKPNNKIVTKKNSFIKGIENWQWIIGTGYYEDDIKIAIMKMKQRLDLALEEHIKSVIQVALLLTFILFFLSIYFSRILEKSFQNYKNEITKYIDDNEKHQNILAQQSKMAAMGEMIGNIAHQWRQPLSTITTSATGMQLQKELKILDDADLLNGLDIINQSAQYLSHTIDDFRSFFATNKKEAYFNIKNTIQQSISLVSMHFYKKDIEIIEDIHNVEICTYENELIQVIINLLNNARDELIKKDIHQLKLLFITTKQEEKKLILTIKDNAGGIPFPMINKIFDPYFSTKDSKKGTGIGLYMSKNIITKNMRGIIEARNEKYTYNNKKYVGAIFTITLPIT